MMIAQFTGSTGFWKLLNNRPGKMSVMVPEDFEPDHLSETMKLQYSFSVKQAAVRS